VEEYVGMMGLVLRNGMWSELDIFKMVSGGVPRRLRMFWVCIATGEERLKIT